MIIYGFETISTLYVVQKKFWIHKIFLFLKPFTDKVFISIPIHYFI